MRRPVKVLCVDDSALMRKMLTTILSRDPDIEVVGVAPDPLIARERIKRLEPDVLTLDIEMPKMDGLTFLEKLMRLRPMPVVMVSSLTERGAEASLRALELGAVDVVAKPKEDLSRAFPELADALVRTVKGAATARVRATRGAGSASGSAGRSPGRTGREAPAPKGRPSHPRPSGLPASGHDPRSTTRPERMVGIIAVGASTGGTEAIREVLSELPAEAPPVVIAQHIPPSFSGPFARRLDTYTALSVAEAEHGVWLEPGRAYVAPGDRHLLVERSGGRYRARLSDAPRVNRHRPSVDVLFGSVAEHAGPSAVGILLTGMGDDGARGLFTMREAGAFTIAQDELTSVVWGMPGEAVRLGAAWEVLPLWQVAARTIDLIAREDQPLDDA